MTDVSTHDVLLALLILLLVVTPLAALAWRAGRRFRGDDRFQVLVRCRDGHVFTTTWIPFVSFNAIRLGAVRFQYCPVGRHWTFIAPVRD